MKHYLALPPWRVCTTKGKKKVWFHKSHKQLNKYMPLHTDNTWNLRIFISLFHTIAKTAICTYLCMNNSSSFLGSKAKGRHWLLLCPSLCVHRDLEIWMLLFSEFENKTTKYYLNETALAFSSQQLSGKHANKTTETITCFFGNISIISPFKKRTKLYWKL